MAFSIHRRLTLMVLFYGALSVCYLIPLDAAESTQKNFTSIRQEDMDQIENLHERAQELVTQRNFREAINIYSEILLTEPDDDGAYTNMGQAYMVLGDFERAKDAFQNALDINPDNDIATFGLRKIADPDFP